MILQHRIGFALALGLAFSFHANSFAEEVKLICPQDVTAKVKVNGVPVGDCPGAIDLPPGDFTILIVFPDGAEWSKSVSIEKGTPMMLFPQASPPATTSETKPEPAEKVTPPDVDPTVAAPPPIVTPTPTLPPPPAPVAPNKPQEEPKTAGKTYDLVEGTNVNWYKPQAHESKIAWNTHDPWRMWGESTRAALGITAHSGPELKTDPKLNRPNAAGLELVLRYEAAVGLSVGRRLNDGATILGISFNRHNGYLLHDFGVPDISLGLLFPDLQARIISDFDKNLDLSVLASIGGARLVYEDLGVVDIRIQLPGFWYRLPYDGNDVPFVNANAFESGPTSSCSDIENSLGLDSEEFGEAFPDCKEQSGWSWGISMDVGVAF
jgi:hypothetical protein